MKLNLLAFLVFAIFLAFPVIGNLQGPESELLDKSKQYERKSAKGLDEDSTAADVEESAVEIDTTDDENDESGKFVRILAEDLNMPSAGIKIIKAPDLSKESDSKKISETLALMLESQEKWIQKFEEELEEMNKNEAVVEVEVVKTAEEIEGNE